MARPTKLATKQEKLTKIATDAVKADCNLSDVAMVLATLDKSVKELDKLKKDCSSIDEFLEFAAKRADVELITAAIKAATGYDYEEITEEIKQIKKYDYVNGETIEYLVEEPAGKKHYKKHSKPDPALLKFILSNRLPEYFNDTKRVEINKKSIEIKEITAEEIKSFAGKLANSLEDDIIDTEFEVEHSPGRVEDSPKE